MLTWSIVLQRIKDETGLPFQPFEKTDEEIVEYLKNNAIRKYSTYFPQKWRLALDTSDPTIKVPDRQNEYYMIDPDEREIFNVTDFIPVMGDHLMLNHTFMGAWTYNELPNWHLQNFQANNLRPWSNFNFNTEFTAPNRVRITPEYSGQCTLEYERMHSTNLDTIETDRHDLFIDLCLGMTMMLIGRIRKKFTNIQTPFGEININAEEIFNDGKEIFDKTIELFKVGALPNIIFDKG